jgi:hypothetical protein
MHVQVQGAVDDMGKTKTPIMIKGHGLEVRPRFEPNTEHYCYADLLGETFM